MFSFAADRMRSRAGWALSILLVCFGNSVAERLPIKTYTTADGLAQNAVNQIVLDSRGFLWFCTEDGLSRYDGYTFTNYGVEHGLADSQVRTLLETRDGEYWVGTESGLCRFNPRGRPLTADQNNNRRATNKIQPTTADPMFVRCRTNDQSKMGSGYVLLEDQTGVVWCGAGRGLYRLEQTNGEWVLRFIEIGLPRAVENDMIVHAL